MRFNRDAFLAILERSNYPNRAAFAKAVGISAGALSDITNVASTGRPRRHPSPELIRRFATELKVPISALLHDPEQVAS